MIEHGQVDPQQVFDECNERLDTMVNHLTTIAREQGALQLGAVDFIKMKRTFEKQMTPFMLQFLAAAAVTRLVNEILLSDDDIPNN